MYTFIIIFAIAVILSVLFAFNDNNETETTVAPSESKVEEPVVIEKPTVVVENKIVDLQKTKKLKPKSTMPPKAKQAKKTN